MEIDLIANFWRRVLKGSPPADNASSWHDETRKLYELGISMEETLQYLHGNNPTLVAFKIWIESQRSSVASCTGSGDILSEEDLAFWDANGYLVLRNAIPPEDCVRTRDAILAFTGKDLDDPATWYVAHESQRGMMVNFYNHPALDKNRSSPRIRKAYEQLYQNESIVSTIDKVSFNPPVTEHYNFTGSGLHWDVSLKLPIPFRLQGLLYLSDCFEEEGAFHCVPGFHRKIARWLRTVPYGQNPRQLALEALAPEPIIGKAGDFIIWHQALPHCATPNRGMLPRLVQYMTYLPVVHEEAEEWV